jgi:hypothetical protein
MPNPDLATPIAPSRHLAAHARVSPRRGRRLTGSVLVALGFTVLVVTALLPWYVYPRVAALPDDPQDGSTLTATGASMLVPDPASSTGARVLTNADVRITTFVSGIPAEARGDSVSWRIATQTFVDGHGLINAQVEQVSLNRRTAAPTNCCGDRLLTQAQDTEGETLRHRGYIVWPFNLQKHSYPLWDVTLRNTKTARFEDVETRLGVRVYRYRSTVPLQAVGTMDLPGGFFGDSHPNVRATSQYADVATYWVEPATGGVVALQEQTTRQYVYGGATVTAFAGTLVAADPAASRLSDYRRGARVMPLVRGQYRWAQGGLGLGLVVLGPWLLSTRRRPAREAIR